MLRFGNHCFTAVVLGPGCTSEFPAAAAAAKSLQSCPTLRPHRWQPTRLLCPWDSPGKNNGVGCHFLLQCIKVKSQSEVAQSYSTLCDPIVCSLPGSSIHGVFQARVLEWGAIAFSVSLVIRSYLRGRGLKELEALDSRRELLTMSFVSECSNWASLLWTFLSLF